MKIVFSKYQGAGNDFIIIDNRKGDFNALTSQSIYQLCHRRLGIGADGLIFLNFSDDYDFEMRYFNADGKEGSMCGNGARCLVDFAKQKSLFETDCHFMAYDGPHYARWYKEQVRLKMNDVINLESGDGYYFLDTGSPHYIEWVDDLDTLNVRESGKRIRNNKRFRKEGTNVNFVKVNSQDIELRTYERGVEEETLACGTGAVASAIVAHHSGRFSSNEIIVKTLGGNLKVSFESNQSYQNVFLSGPYKHVFDGVVKC